MKRLKNILLNLALAALLSTLAMPSMVLIHLLADQQIALPCIKNQPTDKAELNNGSQRQIAEKASYSTANHRQFYPPGSDRFYKR